MFGEVCCLFFVNIYSCEYKWWEFFRFIFKCFLYLLVYLSEFLSSLLLVCRLCTKALLIGTFSLLRSSCCRKTYHHQLLLLSKSFSGSADTSRTMHRLIRIGRTEVWEIWSRYLFLVSISQQVWCRWTCVNCIILCKLVLQLNSIHWTLEMQLELVLLYILILYFMCDVNKQLLIPIFTS